MAGRIESYTHSDSIQENKGGCLVEVVCDTDFSARTDEFKAFAKKVAMMAYGFGSNDWLHLAGNFPQIEEERAELEKAIREKITVRTIRTVKLTEDWLLERERAGKK